MVVSGAGGVPAAVSAGLPALIPVVSATPPPAPATPAEPTPPRPAHSPTPSLAQLQQQQRDLVQAVVQQQQQQQQQQVVSPVSAGTVLTSLPQTISPQQLTALVQVSVVFARTSVCPRLSSFCLGLRGKCHVRHPTLIASDVPQNIHRPEGKNSHLTHCGCDVFGLKTKHCTPAGNCEQGGSGNKFKIKILTCPWVRVRHG